jgi:hypothetical protein
MNATAPRGNSWRHRVVAVGWGWAGLKASRALKHDLANITDVLVFSARVALQGTARANHRTSVWPQLTLTAAAVFAASALLIALYAATSRERKTTPQERIETALTAGYFTSHRCLWHSPQTQKGWC